MPHLDGSPTHTEIVEEIQRSADVNADELERLVNRVDDWISDAYDRGKRAGELAEMERNDTSWQDWQS